VPQPAGDAEVETPTDESERAERLSALETRVEGSEATLNRRLVKVEARLEALGEASAAQVEASRLTAEESRERLESMEVAIRDALRTQQEEAEQARARLEEEAGEARERLEQDLSEGLERQMAQLQSTAAEHAEEGGKRKLK
jgi:hypothetical protein